MNAQGSAMSDPWLLTREHLDEAERDMLPLLSPDVAAILRPVLRPEHARIVERINGLAWDDEPVDHAVREAFSILVDATVPSGLVDPAADAADVPWCAMLRRMIAVPVLGSKKARQWFAIMQRFRWNDVLVSPISEGVASYAVALMEHLRGRESEARYWMRVGAIQNEDDDRAGLGVAVVIRAARLLTGSAS